ncbi:hypothetical protein [Aliamphritea spongicola]|nr:hypothetical protein [Aliamphritea spongicola]
MYHGETDALLATTEQMLLHVDMEAGKTAPIRAEVHGVLEKLCSVTLICLNRRRSAG